MTLRHLLAGAALAAGLFGAAAANAATVIGDEGDAGFIGSLFGPVFADQSYQVASDGEVAFHPFGATFDVSDGLDFSLVNFVWDQAADSIWTNIGHQTWVLPATTSCGAENEPSCEPVGHFISPTPWVTAALGTWDILEGPNGGLSDRIVTFNSAQGAELLFFSDPIGGVPEPAAWAMMLTGFFGMGAVLRGRRKAAGAVPA
jgi:hypothetical protein